MSEFSSAFATDFNVGTMPTPSPEKDQTYYYFNNPFESSFEEPFQDPFKSPFRGPFEKYPQLE